MLLQNRKRSIEQNQGSFSWNAGMKAYEWAFKKRKNLDFVNGKMKNKAAKVKLNALGKQKKFPTFSEQSYSKQTKLNLK